MNRSPRVAFARLEPVRPEVLAEAQPDALRAGAHLAHLRFDRTDLSGHDLSGTSFEECEFVEASLPTGTLRGLRITESTIAGLDAPVLRASRATLRDVEISRSRIGSVDLSEANLNAVLIVGSKLGFVNLRGAQLNNVILQDCRIDELDLSGARVSRLTLLDTSVETFEVTAARLAATDLRRAQLRRAVGMAALAGATISPEQAALFAEAFAAHLGIHVAD